MADKSASPDGKPAVLDAATTPAVPPKRGPGHRGADVKDTVAEMAAKAHEISLEAGSKMAAAMKDVINAAAGITGFVVESARDLVQYMVRRGQMTQEEADKLIRQAEEAHASRLTAPPKSTAAAAPAPVTRPATTKVASAPAPKAETEREHSEGSASAGKKVAEKKPAAKKTTAKSSEKATEKPVTKKGAAKETAAKAPAAKKTAKKK